MAHFLLQWERVKPLSGLYCSLCTHKWYFPSLPVQVKLQNRKRWEVSSILLDTQKASLWKISSNEIENISIQIEKKKFCLKQEIKRDLLLLEWSVIMGCRKSYWLSVWSSGGISIILSNMPCSMWMDIRHISPSWWVLLIGGDPWFRNGFVNLTSAFPSHIGKCGTWRVLCPLYWALTVHL